ncbi:DUF922 domain-containing Zn-dependent protease [Undibacterium sp. JH2W]|uniref:DUF922 domain-containing Zn-dependent protease n=1 Tax=Undibacterium sp. JH2W TaxID=3413037 RepID=UPI003BF0D188
MPVKSMILLGLALACALAKAEVQEAVSYIRYPVRHQAAGSLLQAINAASPIGEGGRKYHGHTQWDIRWKYTYDKLDDLRSCKVKTVTVMLKIAITLPELSSDDDRAVAQFKTYLPALEKHEFGHVQIARDAARKVEQGLLAQAAMPSCEALKSTMNEKGMLVLEEAKILNAQYDAQTQHGKTQGAFLPR